MDKKLIQKTLEYWQPKYDTMGVKLTEEDAREIIDNMTGFIKLLDEWDRAENEKEGDFPKNTTNNID